MFKTVISISIITNTAARARNRNADSNKADADVPPPNPAEEQMHLPRPADPFHVHHLLVSPIHNPFSLNIIHLDIICAL
jgi:hypothetical protein